jgi:putative toxin-antitoxin system antitoxin component (TIGR02293 family)
MATMRSPAAGPPAGTGKRGASPVVKPRAKSLPAVKSKSRRVLAAEAALQPAVKSNTTEQPAAKPEDPVTGKSKPTPASAPLAGPKAPLSYINVYRASPLERIDLIRRGIPASEAKRLFAELPIGQGTGFKALNLSTATVNKKAKHGDTLSPEDSERVVGFAKLVGQLEAMIQDSGDPTNFDARAWIARWLTEPLPAFGGARPADLVDTMEGQGLVSAALAKIQSGAYA